MVHCTSLSLALSLVGLTLTDREAALAQLLNSNSLHVVNRMLSVCQNENDSTRLVGVGWGHSFQPKAAPPSGSALRLIHPLLTQSITTTTTGTSFCFGFGQ